MLLPELDRRGINPSPISNSRDRVTSYWATGPHAHRTLAQNRYFTTHGALDQTKEHIAHHHICSLYYEFFISIGKIFDIPENLTNGNEKTRE